MKKNRSFAYFDHEADIGVIGKGKTLEDAFIAAAEAVFSIMTDITKIKPTQSITITFEESDIEFALVTWLNLLISESIISGLIFRSFDLEKQNSHWQGHAKGEPWHASTTRGTEVKGATLTMLCVEHHGKEWEAKCVVDV